MCAQCEEGFLPGTNGECLDVKGLLLHMNFPDSKVRGANMGPIWGRQDPGGPHVGPMDLVIWGGCKHEALLLIASNDIDDYNKMDNVWIF